jgi:hypothetical protein
LADLAEIVEDERKDVKNVAVVYQEVALGASRKDLTKEPVAVLGSSLDLEEAGRAVWVVELGTHDVLKKKGKDATEALPASMSDEGVDVWGGEGGEALGMAISQKQICIDEKET